MRSTTVRATVSAVVRQTLRSSGPDGAMIVGRSLVDIAGVLLAFSRRKKFDVPGFSSAIPGMIRSSSCPCTLRLTFDLSTSSILSHSSICFLILVQGICTGLHRLLFSGVQVAHLCSGPAGTLTEYHDHAALQQVRPDRALPYRLERLDCGPWRTNQCFHRRKHQSSTCLVTDESRRCH